MDDSSDIVKLIDALSRLPDEISREKAIKEAVNAVMEQMVYEGLWPPIIDNCDGAFQSLAPDEKKEVLSIVDDIIAQPDNWQIRFMSWLATQKTNNPVIAKLVYFLLFAMFTILTAAAGTALADSWLRDAPNSSSDVVVIVPQNSAVIIIGDAPYYFEVEYTDENGEEHTGWMSKRSIKLQDAKVSE